MPFMPSFSLPRKVVLSHGTRTPVGHIAHSLATVRPEALMQSAVESTLRRAKLPKEAVDGLIVGWVGQVFSAPNIARVTLLKSGLPEKAQAVTVQNNCVSSIESVCAAARAIAMGEGDVYIAGGTESMSRLPYSIDGSRAMKELRSLDTVKEKWGTILQSPDVIIDDALEQGLTDPVKKINMAATAEVCAQMYGISREAQDDFARQSFAHALEGWKSQFYETHVVPFQSGGQTLLDKDEYPFLRESLPQKPAMFAKAPALFDHSSYPIENFFKDYGVHMDGVPYQPGRSRGTVTLFNSCGRSDGASAIVVASEEKARALGLEILGEIRGWAFHGNNPAHMGVAPALAAPDALKNAGLRFDDLDSIELHEPFAATVLSIFKLGKEKFGCDWEGKFKSGALNPHGGSIAIGHPLGATGTRLLLNLLYSMRLNPMSRHGMIAACAGGGMGGALVVRKV